MSTNSTKAKLRQKLLGQRKELDARDVAVRSAELVEKLLAEVNVVHNIHCFLPLTDDNEPDLREFIENMVSQNIRVYTSNPANRSVQKIDDVELGQFKLSDDRKFDLIIVPMLGFDGLHRLGFGGGFYDKFLATQPQAQKIGVCFKEFELDNLPAEPHDVPLDVIIVA